MYDYNFNKGKTDSINEVENNEESRQKCRFCIKFKDIDFDNYLSKKYLNITLFNEVAPIYNFSKRVLSFFRDRSWKKKLIKSLPDLTNPACLDIACGTGDIAFLLKNKFIRTDIYALDLNDNMIQIANKKKDAVYIKFKIGDMMQTGFDSKFFDIVAGGYALRNSPDLKLTLSEIRRIMKEDGIGAFLEFSKSHIKFIQDIQLFLLKLWGSFWGALLHFNPDVYGYIAESLKHFPDTRQIKNLLSEMGFRNIRSKHLFFGFIELIFFQK
jgi:ubiquinone/menaquinone biosynthesis methyltransferase